MSVMEQEVPNLDKTLAYKLPRKNLVLLLDWSKEIFRKKNLIQVIIKAILK